MSADTTDFHGKTVFVSAGSKGIGRGLVEAFVELGSKVLTTYRSEDESAESLKSLSDNLECLQVDFLKSDDIEKCATWLSEKATKIDFFINNAGDAIERSAFKDSEDKLWESNFQLNLMSLVHLTKKSFTLFNHDTETVIINVSSIAGTTSGAGDSLHYGVSKAAVNTFTKGLAKEWGKFNIRVCGVAPSAIDTNFQQRLSSPERVQKIVDQTPLGRIGQVEEVVDPILFLCSSAASYISGETLSITGGR